MEKLVTGLGSLFQPSEKYLYCHTMFEGPGLFGVRYMQTSGYLQPYIGAAWAAGKVTTMDDTAIAVAPAA